MAIHKIVIAPYSAHDMFMLVDDIESYSDFLPWCEKTEVTRNGEDILATVFINYHGLRVSFSTKNCHKSPSSVSMALANGPLSDLCGAWSFTDLDDNRCRVEFNLTYRFADSFLSKSFEILFEKIFGHFVETFIARAQEKYTTGRGKIRVQVVDNEAEQPLKRDIDLPIGATLADALAACGRENADIVGVWGTVSEHNRPLNSGDRVEVYKGLNNDPREARRRRSRPA